MPDPDDQTPQGGPPNGRGGPRHELSELDLGGILKFLAALVTLLVVVFAVLGAIMTRFARTEKRNEAAAPPRSTNQSGQFPEPRSQVIPREELAAYRDREASIVNGYGWVDKTAGIARIPIERAMDIVAERGLPKGKTTPPRGSRTRDQP